MSGYVTGMKVPPRSRAEIRRLANVMHKHLHYDESRPFPVVEVLEFVLPKLYRDYNYEILPIEEMGDDHGKTFPDKRLIYIREDVYDGACDNKGRDRFTICHEISHLLLHSNLDVTLLRETSPHKFSI